MEPYRRSKIWPALGGGLRSGTDRNWTLWELKLVQNVLIVGKGAPYDFVPEGQTERLRGVKLHYLLMGAPLIAPAEGFQPVSASVSVEEAAKVKIVPARYDAGFSVTMNAGKPQIKLVSIDASSALEVEL